MKGALNRGIARSLTAVLCLAGTAQLVGPAQGFDILDMAQPPPPLRRAGWPARGCSRGARCWQPDCRFPAGRVLEQMLDERGCQ